MRIFRAWRRSRWLRRNRLPDELWRQTLRDVPLLRGLALEEKTLLHDLLVIFLHEKAFQGAAGLDVTPFMRLAIGAQACLLVLRLGMDYYDGWVEILVYPGGFSARHRFHDEAGVVHEEVGAFSGEAWLRGPVILSWEEVREDLAAPGEGYNVVVHEFAHKLDMLNGPANGFPPLHREMDAARWTNAFARAYETLQTQVDRGLPTAVDPYGTTNPGEFFAVLTETFFDAPGQLAAAFPDVYAELRSFYLQDPLVRAARAHS
jgi:Mlc titration factor MtfA (ptsG expression regulator)